MVAFCVWPLYSFDRSHPFIGISPLKVPDYWHSSFLSPVFDSTGQSVIANIDTLTHILTLWNQQVPYLLPRNYELTYMPCKTT